MSDVSLPSPPLQTAVLFLVFNRPDTTKQVFDAIRQAKPPLLYVAADGARLDLEGEAERIAQVRQIATAVDWPCEVKTLFREKNLGCKMAVSGGIDWFFQNEGQGIILEDDCVPNNDFFRFCEEMLDRYRHDPSIGMVSGFNPLGPGLVSNEYFSSRNPSIWGWATWQDRWMHYDVNMADWHNSEIKKQIRSSLSFRTFLYYRRCFDLTTKKSISTWGYQWTFFLIHRKCKTIKPLANLIKNIGIEGTHAVAEDINHNVKLGTFNSLPLIRNDSVSYMQDEWFFRTRIPSAPKMLVLNLLEMTGLYEFVSASYRRIKAVKNRFV